MTKTVITYSCQVDSVATCRTLPRLPHQLVHPELASSCTPAAMREMVKSSMQSMHTADTVFKAEQSVTHEPICLEQTSHIPKNYCVTGEKLKHPHAHTNSLAAILGSSARQRPATLPASKERGSPSY